MVGSTPDSQKSTWNKEEEETHELEPNKNEEEAIVDTTGGTAIGDNESVPAVAESQRYQVLDEDEAILDTSGMAIVDNESVSAVSESPQCRRRPMEPLRELPQPGAYRVSRADHSESGSCFNTGMRGTLDSDTVDKDRGSLGSAR